MAEPSIESRAAVRSEADLEKLDRAKAGLDFLRKALITRDEKIVVREARIAQLEAQLQQLKARSNMEPAATHVKGTQQLDEQSRLAMEPPAQPESGERPLCPTCQSMNWEPYAHSLESQLSALRQQLEAAEKQSREWESAYMKATERLLFVAKEHDALRSRASLEPLPDGAEVVWKEIVVDFPKEGERYRDVDGQWYTADKDFYVNQKKVERIRRVPAASFGVPAAEAGKAKTD